MQLYRNFLQTLFLVSFLFILSIATTCLQAKNIPGISEDQFPNSKHDLHFKSLAKSWDEGIPLGNGMLGALIWQKGNALRISLDRADLWDSRTPKEFNGPEFKFSWVIDHVKKDDYGIVQKLFDEPYDRDPFPTKLPPSAIEFNLPGINKVKSVNLYLNKAVCEINWSNGIKLTSFVAATANRGWFKIVGVTAKVKPVLQMPLYSNNKSKKDSSVSGPEGNDLEKLGYQNATKTEGKNKIIYHQICSDGFTYDVKVEWTYSKKTLLGVWTIVPNRPYPLSDKTDTTTVRVDENNFKKDFSSHEEWWNKFWKKSSVQVPDEVIEAQYYRELYKFGSASRKGAPPISLQAIWTADNGKLPPWKGDFHNDLNTQMSYWPGYSSNHLEESSVFTDWLWNCKPVAEEYTKKYFGTAGLNFPGVATLDGKPMGGWIQYAFGPTVSAWLAQNFYWQWRYSMDKEFLSKRAYPWVKEVATYLDQISVGDESGKRKLPLSSSPELYDNSIKAWFNKTTNFDLSLIRWLYGAASEMADSLNLKDEALKWKNILNEWPELALFNKFPKLLIAPEIELKGSHRHFSHMMALYPLGLLDINNAAERRTIYSSLADISYYGTDLWCGYSYTWAANMYARALNGRRAAQLLKIFATSFCSPNSFHLNGDQSNNGYSTLTYKPFTLEGNFAFASALQEMLLQSQNNLIKIFPATPWSDASFNNLRAEGAFLISAEKKDGKIVHVKIYSEKGEKIKMENPFGDNFKINGKEFSPPINNNKIIELDTKSGEIIDMTK
jgi:alpha-L-fucosidase 2